MLAASAIALASTSAFATAAQARPVSVKLNYTCTFPLMVPQPLELTIKSEIPETVPPGTLGQRYEFDASANVSAVATQGLRALESTTIEGTAKAAATLSFPDGFVQNVTVSTVVTKRDIPVSGAFDTAAKGSTPALTFDDVGVHELRVGNLVLVLSPRLADGTLTGLDEFETECALVPGQNNLLSTVTVAAAGDTAAPSTPAGLNGSAAETSATLSWTPSTDNVAVTGYDVFQDGVQVQSVAGTTAAISGLTGGKAYKFKVRAKDAAGNTSAFSDEITVTTTTKTPDTFAYALTGTASVKTLTKGSFPVRGAMNANFVAGALSADLSFQPASARLVSLGFLPITAKIQLVPSGRTTGKLEGGVLSTSSQVRIKVPEVRLFGAIPLVGGSGCQSKQYSAINLKSSAGFVPAQGGQLSGTFAISDLNGCGVLNGLVSPLTAGGGNTLVLSLAPVAPVPTTTSAR